ncbi:nucleolin 1-like [Brassica napus]|uniref:nucleolin 1-like n=1 Tax=Brassica napus TaxID=3708 RepID=UPI0020789650|nr:nucleolin 1-like [Brassica napus]
MLSTANVPFSNSAEEKAEEKALALDGTDMGGWNVTVKVLPHDDLEFTTDQLAAMSISHFKKTRSEGVSVRGYDNSLPSNDIKSALTKHFASCGEITDVFVLKRRAVIYFFGWHAISKAVELSGSSVGGCELVVKALPVPKRNLGPPPPPSLPFWLYYNRYIT